MQSPGAIALGASAFDGLIKAGFPHFSPFVDEHTTIETLALFFIRIFRGALLDSVTFDWLVPHHGIR